MKTVKMFLVALMGLALVQGTLYAKEESKNDSTQGIALSELPQAVQDAINTRANNTSIEKIQKKTVNGKTIYSVKLENQERFKVDADGKIIQDNKAHQNVKSSQSSSTDHDASKSTHSDGSTQMKDGYGNNMNR